MMDNNFDSFALTRPWRDGGRDAVGYYVISTGNVVNYPLKVDDWLTNIDNDNYRDMKYYE